MKNIFLSCLLLLFVTSCTLGTKKTQDINQGFFEGQPGINKPSITGNYPKTPFLFAVPTCGKRPMEWKAVNLPTGLQIDSKTGFITGIVNEPGNYVVKITATNELGSDTKDLTIAIGDKLTLTPAMGWNSWNTFTNTLNEQLVKNIADVMDSTGMRDLGYQYVNIDDFWQLLERDSKGNIQINKEKFPNGIKAVADYVHSKGLKLGVYSDAADRTCGGVAGSFGYEERDAQAIASWGVDLLKYDYCNAPPSKDTAIIRYTRMHNALKKTGRSIVFSICEWGPRKAWNWAASVGGNYWRTTWDIRDTWDQKGFDSDHCGIIQILDVNAELAEFAGPGHWNDPDMLIVGIYGKGKATSNNELAKGCTDAEYRSHMSLWCLMSAPLLCGNDLRIMNVVTKETLMNPEIIAINQDELGKQAKRIIHKDDVDVFVKPLMDGSFAVGLLNRNDKAAKKIKINWDDLKITGKHLVRDLWERKDLGDYSDSFEVEVPVHSCKVIRISKN